MWLDPLERHAAGSGPLHRLDPRAKLAATLGFVVLAVATPADWWRVRAAEALGLAFVVGLAGVDPATLFRRWLALLAPLGFLAVAAALGRPAAERPGAVAAIVAKNGLALLAVLTLAAVTPLPRLLGALRRLGAPAVLVATLLLMERNLRILADELTRMTQARRARTFRRRGPPDWARRSALIGVLFVRTLERGERVHAAMVARGWDGHARPLD